jgi:hypothetical protein
VTVIHLPISAKPTSERAFEPDPHSTVDAAFEVNQMIFNGLRMEELRDLPNIPSALLSASPIKHFGSEWAHRAEMLFEHVYGVYPLLHRRDE